MKNLKNDPLIITLAVSAVIFISTIFFVYLLVGDQLFGAPAEITPVVTTAPSPQEEAEIECPEYINCMPGPDFKGCEVPEGCEGITVIAS